VGNGEIQTGEASTLDCMSCDDQPGDPVFSYELSAGESLSEGVVWAVSAVSDAEPVPGTRADAAAPPLEPLYTAVDPDALDAVSRLFDAGTPDARAEVTFSYHGFEVTVRDDGRIHVTSGEADAD
jgi:hypothetical protein